MIDTTALLAKTDLMALVEADLGPGKRSGRWWLFRCPFHEDSRPSLAVTPDTGTWHCFACGKSGDAITYLREREGLTFQQAVERLGGGLYQVQAPRPARAERAAADQPPGPAWQQAARVFVDECVAHLWADEGARALAYLHDRRGLTDFTIRHYRLGYNPVELRHSPERWGLPADSGEVVLPRGITIPCTVSGAIWYLKIRRPAGTPKYLNVRGGRAALFGAGNLTGAEYMLLTEGEFDAMLASQTVGDVFGVATLGGAANGIDLAAWGRYLISARTIVAVYDTDPAGETGAAKLAGLLGNIVRLQIPQLRPGDKDLTDFVMAGGDLWQWLSITLWGEEAQQNE